MLIPSTKPTTPFWLSQPSQLAELRSTDSVPESVDVVIVGAGYSGAATAYHLLEGKSTPKSVVIFEARQACSGASGRNGGHMRPDLYTSWVKLEQAYGVEAAALVAKFELQGLYDAQDIVSREQIDCELELTKTSDVFLDPQVQGSIVHAFKEMEKSGLIDTSDYELIASPEEAERMTRVKGALGAITYTAGHIWPYKLITHLLQRAVDMGANLQTNTPVISLEASKEKHYPWLVSTERGSTRAKSVVLATNAYTGGLLPSFAERITPVRGVACHIRPEQGSHAELLTRTYSLRYGPGMFDYLIQRLDGSIVVGGAKQAVLKHRDFWYGNAQDNELIPGAVEYFDNFMQRTFHGWEDSNAHATYTWTGIMGYTNDDLPYVGPVPGLDGLYVSAGFSGHGMPRILACSRAIAQLLSEEAQSMSDTDVPWMFWVSEKRLSDESAQLGSDVGLKGLAGLMKGEKMTQKQVAKA